MRLKFCVIVLLFILKQQYFIAQATYIPMFTDEYKLMDRLEGMAEGNNPYFMTTLKPYSRWDAYQMVDEFDESISLFALRGVKPIDEFNIKRFKAYNGEWGKGNYMYYDATPRRPEPLFLKHFYASNQHMLLFSDEQYFVSINPVLHVQGGLDEYSEDLGFINRRGVEVRARLFNSIGIYTTLSDNQERLPKFIDKVGTSWKAYPGYTDHTGRTNGKPYDAFYSRAYIDFPIIREKVELTFGFDKNFIGDGIRSVILSDLAGPYTFLRLRYHFGKFFYQNLFMELMPDYYGNFDISIPKKYASIHFLGYKLNHKIEIGLVETNNYRMSEMKAGLFVPIIFARSVQRVVDQKNDEYRNSAAFTTKIIWAKDFITYTQFNLQNFDRTGENNWLNQFAYQVGIKYMNIAKIPTLDMQVEWNGASPFMYSSSSVLKNFTHYNQPMAHHLESAFSEFIFSLTYQPIAPLQLGLRTIYSTGSSKTQDGSSNGSDIYKSYFKRTSNHNFSFMGDGSFKSFHTAIYGSYEFFPNMFADGGFHYLKSSSKIDSKEYSNILLYVGVRINAPKRLYDWNQ